MKKNLFLKLTFITLASIGIASTALANVTAPITMAKKPLEVSYIQTSLSATLAPKDTAKSIYSLTLVKVDPYTTYFSDRPNREIGKVTNQFFLTHWSQGKDSFSKDAPNAMLNGLTEINSKIQSVNIPMVLSSPVYDPAKDTMTYSVMILDKDQATPTSRNLSYDTLFIDEACITCIG